MVADQFRARNNADKRSYRRDNEATVSYGFGIRVRVDPQLRSVLALGQRRYFQLRMRRSSVSIVQSNGLQWEIRSVRSLEIQEIMVPSIVVVVVAAVLLPREG